MSDHKLVEALPCPFCGGKPATVERPDNIDGTQFFFAVACYCGGYSACAHKMAVRDTPEQAKAAAIAAWNTRHEAEQQAGEAVGACLKVIKGELCYRSRDEDQSFGMWVPVAPDSDHGFNNGAEFAPVAAHPQQPLTREQCIKLWGDRSDGPSNGEIVSFTRAIEAAHGITKDAKS